MNDYGKLQKLIEDASAMLEKEITSDDAEFVAWELSAKRLLAKQFGEDGIEMNTFLDISFYSPLYSLSASSSEKHRNAVRSCHIGLEQAKAILETYLDDFTEEAPMVADNHVDYSTDYSKVFIVHGHDGELKESVARIIEKQDIHAIILSEQANQGKTIIEKIENYSDVGGAICLFTADDFGRSKESDTDRARARQNVVFETGYFIGRLGRDHIVILADDGIEMPSDLSGIVYTGTANWQVDLLRDLKAMGYTVDFNKLF